MESSVETLAVYHITADMEPKPHCTLHSFASISPNTFLNHTVFSQFFVAIIKWERKNTDIIKIILPSIHINKRG